MKLSQLLRKDRIILDLQAQTKDEAIDELSRLLVTSEEVKDPGEFLKSIGVREKLESTGIGNGIGIPHGVTDAVGNVMCAMGISKMGIDYGALDGKPVHLIFLLGIPKNEARAYLTILAHICRLFRDRGLRQQIIDLTSIDEVLGIVSEREKTIP